MFVLLYSLKKLLVKDIKIITSKYNRMQVKPESGAIQNRYNDTQVSGLSGKQAIVVEEAILWQHFKNGNQIAFSSLYKKYIQLLYNYGRHITSDHELVKDCLQELFAGLWNKKESLAEVQSVKHYLFTSFRRMLIQELVKKRKQIGEEALLQQADFEIIFSYESELILKQHTAEQHEHLKRAVNELTKRQKEALFLKFYGNLSYTEVASAMHLQIDSVYNIISKAIDALKKNVKQMTLLLLVLLLNNY